MHTSKVVLLLASFTLGSSALAESGIRTSPASFDFGFTWRNTATNTVIVTNSSAFTFTTTAVTPCAYGSYCRTGTFTSRDGGTGTVTFTVSGNGAGVGNKVQHLNLTYDVTGATYTGSVQIKDTGALYSGTMAFPSNSNYAGTFTQIVPAGVVALSSAETLGDSSGLGLETLEGLQNGTLDEADLAYDDGGSDGSALEASASCSTTGTGWTSMWSLLSRR